MVPSLALFLAASSPGALVPVATAAPVPGPRAEAPRAEAPRAALPDRLRDEELAREAFVPVIEACQRPCFAPAGDPSTSAAPPSGPGSNLLDVYRYGDLALAVDPSGEWFAEAASHAMGGDVTWIMSSIAGAFYKHYGDDYQYLTVLFVHDLGFFGAFYQPLANDVYGIGYDSVSPNEVFDQSGNSLDGYIFMNAAELWDENPAEGRFVFGQEFMHRWGSFVNVQQDGLDPDVLLGRDLAHWSYWFDTTNSPMEGNDWVDNGDGTWTVDYTATSTYSDLDLYLMGLVGPETVPQQTVLLVDEAEQARVNRVPASTPEGFAATYNGSGGPVTVTATPVTFGLDAIIAAEGERVPSVADSPKSFRMATVVVVLPSDELTTEDLEMVDRVRQRFEADWEDDVRGLADLDTTLGDGDAPEWGADSGDTGTEDTATGDSAGAVDTAGEDPKAGGCGCATGPGSAVPSALLAALTSLLLVRRRPGAP